MENIIVRKNIKYYRTKVNFYPNYFFNCDKYCRVYILENYSAEYSKICLFGRYNFCFTTIIKKIELFNFIEEFEKWLPITYSQLSKYKFKPE